MRDPDTNQTKKGSNWYFWIQCTYSKRYNELAGEYESLLCKREEVEKEKKAQAEKREVRGDDISLYERERD